MQLPMHSILLSYYVLLLVLLKVCEFTEWGQGAAVPAPVG